MKLEIRSITHVRCSGPFAAPASIVAKNAYRGEPLMFVKVVARLLSFNCLWHSRILAIELNFDSSLVNLQLYGYGSSAADQEIAVEIPFEEFFSIRPSPFLHKYMRVLAANLAKYWGYKQTASAIRNRQYSRIEEKMYEEHEKAQEAVEWELNPEYDSATIYALVNNAPLDAE